ncbi:hypothetical protein AAFC00_004827 [Neodothiora populina]|uniref:Oxidase ustYa n=1 Tax=Neodothiora populina TaxID=2781224 RepID=A0ABR3P3B0_9PEZI
MSSLDYFRRKGTNKQHYDQVAEEEEEDKMLPKEQNQVSDRKLLELERANRNLRWILGIFSATFVLFGALVAFRSIRYDGLLLPQILRTPVPPMPMNIHIFERNEKYASRPSLESDIAWDDLLPNGRGFVYVPDSKKYGLPPGESTYFGEIYSVAMFHQLHCLGQLRKYHWMLVDGVVANDTEGLKKMTDSLLGPDGEHVHHCFDYLRQTLQCAGDMALEWPREEEDGKRYAVDGWGIPHECRSWDHIREYMVEHHFNGSTNSHIAPDHPMMA